MAGATITLKNVPTELHRSLKESARRHKRSLNQEAIHYLESAMLAGGDERPSLLQPPAVRSVGRVLVSEQELNLRDEAMMDRES